MAAVVTRNPDTDPTAEVDSPIKGNGSRYRYEMIFDNQRSRAYADLARDLLDVLIEGYAALSPEDAVQARIEYATDLLAPVQATVLQGNDTSNLTEDEHTALFQPRYAPVLVEEWSSEVPLVLLDVHYAPFSDIPPPVSAIEDVENPRNLVWLRAADEDEFLRSLNHIGMISLGESSDYTV